MHTLKYLLLSLTQATQEQPALPDIGHTVDVIKAKYGIETPVNTQAVELLLNEHHLPKSLIKHVTQTLACSNQYHIAHTPLLAIIDYSLPSNQKRFWVFDLKKHTLNYQTYVSHGIKTGQLNSDYFSNTNDSKASSIGVFRTLESYYGREGLSLRLEGLDPGLNDNAMRRYIVMHGGWYMNEKFIKQYGRPGRSWGCPAVPLHLAPKIINQIKEYGLVIAFSGDEKLKQSKFSQCNIAPLKESDIPKSTPIPENIRDDILYVAMSKGSYYHENNPILAISSPSYQMIFKKAPPVNRMLRRRLNHMEYIAITPVEFQEVIRAKKISSITFITPRVVLMRGSYHTLMEPHQLGNIASGSAEKLELTREKLPSLKLGVTHQFIRWIGL